MIHDAHNVLFSLAGDFINYSNKSLFLTGKAGTGKTTFLKYIRQHTPKQVAVVAPTGVAAINAGGVTIHSFFQLPFTPFIPEAKKFLENNAINKHHLLGRIKLTRERRQILRQLEMLIIDEISMVRCDVLDAVDTVLRSFRNSYEPFGGVQVLYIGDMFQLPPVVTNEEWQVLSAFYDSPYFFASKVIGRQQPVHIELEKIYRQSDQDFIDLLNKVRNNKMDNEGYELLHKNYNPSFELKKGNDYIVLTTHNYKADAINAEQLARLEGNINFLYKAGIEGEFYEKSYPADESLQLKVGAQVMFIRNDVEKSKRYFNGKIGLITKLDAEKVSVKCKDEEDEIELKKEKWENIRYTLNNETQRVEEEVIGSFTQLPLRLAWAITIHKSQGLTFEKAVIDAGAAFAAGQVYVALSRCTTLEGIVLKSRITAGGLSNDARIVNFTQAKHSGAYLETQLQVAKRLYQNSVLTNLFDFSLSILQLKEVIKVVDEHSASFNEETKLWLDALQNNFHTIHQTAIKFQKQLEQLFEDEALPEENEALQKRVMAASNYFSQQLHHLMSTLLQSPAVTDSKQYASAYNNELKDLYVMVSQKLHFIKGCVRGFHVDIYHEHKNSFVLPHFNVNAYALAAEYKKTKSEHPVLHKELRQLRDTICNEYNVPVYLVAASNTIDEMDRYLPQTSEELMRISGFGKSKVDRFGKRFLEVIVNYCEKHQLTSLIHEKIPKRKKKEKKNEVSDTKQETYKLHKEGKTVGEIAAARKLAVGTIEGHLAYFVERGLISVNDLVSREKLVLIEPLLNTFEGGSVGYLKEQLGNNISFGEIRLVLASRNLKTV